MIKPIQDQLEAKEPRMKFVMSIEVIFQQGSDPSIKTKPTVWFHSSPYIAGKQLTGVDKSHQKLEENLQSAADELYEAIKEYEGIGSVIDHLVCLEENLNSY